METKRRGRPAEFRNAAEKQKAYRERQKQQSEASELATWLLDEIKTQYVTLLKSLEWRKKKGQTITVRFHEPPGWNPSADIYADEQYITSRIDLILFRYAVKTGQLVFVEKDWRGDKYIFTELSYESIRP